MRVTLDVPNDLFEKYVGQAQGEPVEKTLLRRLQTFKDVQPDDRAIVIHGDERRKLEAAVQTTIGNFDELYKHFTNMGSVQIGPVTRVFTASELVRIRDQARFHGWTEENFMKLTVDEALDYVFNRL